MEYAFAKCEVFQQSWRSFSVEPPITGMHWEQVCLDNYSTPISILITQVSQLLIPVRPLFTLVSVKEPSG